MADVRFLLDGEVVTVADPDPTGTLLDHLRYRLRRTGTKEGCAEGDCGACTILVGTLEGDRVAWRAINACILFLPMIDGKALLTVESIGRPGAMHPIQQAMAEGHGSQCGFCTPGFVMSLYGRSIGACGTKDASVEDVLSGNLCRCTGYGPILNVGREIEPGPREDAATIAALTSLVRTEPLSGIHADPLAGRERRWHVARTAGELAALLIDHPDARIVAGATDVGLWVTKQQRILDDLIFIGDLADLATIEETPAGLRIGATVRYSDALPALARLHPELGALVRRIGGTQVRNAGTIGGNIANGSPIGDMPPALIALDATLTLRRGDQRRTICIEDYFLDYGKQDRRPGEFVESIFVPCPNPADRIMIAKLSKRFDSDISAVCGAFAVRVERGLVTHARIAFGGMAATPRRADLTERAMIGSTWSEETVAMAMTAVAQDFSPLSDVRGSSAYRLAAAANLLRRLWLADTTDGPLSVLSEAVADG